MQKLQDSVFSIVKTTNLSPAVFNYLQPSEDFPDKTPLGGILSDTKHGWLALGPKFCVVDLRTGLKVAARTFGAALSNFRTTVTSVVELPTPLTTNSQQLLISLECEDIAGMICVFHINGSQILRCIQTDIVVTQLAVSNGIPDGPFSCFDGIVMAGTKTGEIFVFDLNRASLVQALKDVSQGYEHLIRNEENSANITFLPLNAVQQIEAQRDVALENDDHIAVLLNENSIVDGQYIFRNPDGTVRMKAKRNHIRVTVIQYIPQLGSLAVGFNFGAFQIWNLLNLDLEFTSQVNVECLPVTHFGFQEPCDDPRAFCYLWAVFSVIDRFEEEEFPLAVMYSLTYQGKRMLSDTQCLYQEFLTATIRFQVELSTTEENAQLVGGRCVSCHSYSVNSMLGGEGEDSMLNICQLVWECWGENANSSAQYGMLLFDLDQWYKDQMPATYQLQSNAFMSATCCTELARGATATLDVRLVPSSVSVYCAATRLEEHFYPNSLHYDCICLNTSEACVLSTIGIQRQIINSLDEVGPTALLNPTRLYNACVATGLVPLYMDTTRIPSQEEQRRYLLSVALEARLSRFLKRCAHDWATGSHSGAGCTLTFLVDWCWQRALELKENARELTAPLFTSSALPDRNVVRCLEHCVQQLTQLTGLLDAVLTKCCNLVVPDALSEMEEKYKGIGTVSLYFQVVQWFLRCGLLPERNDSCNALPYPATHLANTYSKRRLKLHRLQDHGIGDENAAKKPCSLLYIDQLIEQEFGGERVQQMWIKGGSECHGLYPPPSLYSLLRLYLLPDIAEEHKHSLVLYLLVDYSRVYDEVRYEAVIRRLMQFPTMFGLSNTAIKATQAFWHLDHRDFDFALDQLQCLTGNTLSEWQHNVVLSSLLAQKKTQAALQYLHVRKPAPIQNISNELNNSNNRVNDHDKLDDWQSCCSLYLARGLVFEALDVIRMCVQNAGSLEDKAHVLNFFFKGCRNTGQLAKILQVTLLPFEEEVFIQYLKGCNESQTSDILIMYYLQQARYLEAEQYNKTLKHSKQSRTKDPTGSIESLTDMMDRENARDTIVEVVCASLPAITNTIAHCATELQSHPRVIEPKPMSVFVQAKSPTYTFTYKSTFIQDTIENASETWLHKPKMKRGIKRALDIEDTPFICTPKLLRTKSLFTDMQSESTPPKRARLDLSGTPKTPRMGVKVSDNISKQMEMLLDMPEVQSPDVKIYERSRAETPHSILKIRSNEAMREQPSPVDSRYLGDSDDEMLETASNHTHYSDSTNKHLRFTIPTASESGSTPSPPAADRGPSPAALRYQETERSTTIQGEREADISMESYVTTQSHTINEPHPLESPPKKFASEEKVHSRKSYKDSVRARRSLSISANSSLSEDPNTSIESIADIPVTLINPRYSGERRRSHESTPREDDKATDGVETVTEIRVEINAKIKVDEMEAPKTPRGRRGIRAISAESTPLGHSRSITPERQDSPIIGTPLHQPRVTRSRSRTPEISPRSSPLEPILEQPKQEVECEPQPVKTLLSIPRLRSRSRTPERIEKVVESPRLEAITESPTKSPPGSPASPTRRSLRSRSRTPEVEVIGKKSEEIIVSPRTLRSRSKTPEKLMSPKKEISRSAKKPLSRLVLESNAVKSLKKIESATETIEEKSEKAENVLECTPMKSAKPSNLMDVTLSPIVCKSILHSSTESVLSETKSADNNSPNLDLKTIPGFTMNETNFGKSVLRSHESSAAETSSVEQSNTDESVNKDKSLPAFSLGESVFGKSVLQSCNSSTAETSTKEIVEKEKTDKYVELKTTPASTSLNITDLEKSVLGSCETTMEESKHKDKIMSLMTSDSDIEMKEDNEAVIQKEKEKIVEIEREIHEIEIEMSDEEGSVSSESQGEVPSESDSESPENEEVGEESEFENTTEESADEDDEIISIGSSSSSDRLQIDEESTNTPKKPALALEIHIERTENEEAAQLEETTEPTDPLNQGQLSLMTDDNSLHSNLYYSDENEEDKSKKVSMETDVQPVKEKAISGEAKEIDRPENEIKLLEPQTSTARNFEKADNKSELVQDSSKTSVTSAEEAEISQETPKGAPMEKPIASTGKPQSQETPKTIDVVDNVKETTKDVTKDDENSKSKVSKDRLMDVDEAPEIDVRSKSPNKEEKTVEEPAPAIIINPDVKSKSLNEEAKTVEEPAPAVITNPADSRNVVNATEMELKKVDVENKTGQIDKDRLKPPTLRPRKRTGSTSSNKSSVSIKESETKIEEINTPKTRKRSQSTTSNKSVPEEKTPEEKFETPSRRRAKTPTSAEVRKILTRRVSKELSEKLDDSQNSILDESSTTPKRRSTRSRSKQMDDNASIASGSSVRSTRSKATEDAGDVKPVRKGRKSLLKPDLSVIPELTVEESHSKAEAREDIIKEYSSSRRLTRHQKAVLESWLEPKSSPRVRARRTSSSRASIVSEQSHDDDDASSTHSSVFDVQPIDRISLMNKSDFQGSPDPSEQQLNESPESIASDASKQRRSRMGRAASESRSSAKPARITRKLSVDIAQTPEAGSPVAIGSPARGRRASFTRACEALHTPKGRRTSTDLRKGETDSQHSSPAASESDAVTPARRTRRGSAQSVTSSKTDTSTSKRTKKSAVEESKDTKKK